MAKQSKTTKITPEQEYKKELRRIKQFLRSASKRGFIWFDNPIPKQPKKITTKSVSRLKNITPKTLYKKANFVDEETGEIFSGTKGRSIEKKRATEKAKETIKAKQVKSKDDEAEHENDAYYPNFIDIVLSNFKSQLAQFPNAEGTPLLLSWFDKLLADNGREAVAQMLQDGAEQGLLITWETVYKSVNTKTYMTEMMNYLPDQGNIYKDQIMDMMEQFEWWEQPE